MPARRVNAGPTGGEFVSVGLTVCRVAPVSVEKPRPSSSSFLCLVRRFWNHTLICGWDRKEVIRMREGSM